MQFNILKGVGNAHFDLARVLWLASCVAAIVFTGVHLVMNHAFSVIEFGGGMAAILTGGGVGTAAKDVGVAKAAATAEPSP